MKPFISYTLGVVCGGATVLLGLFLFEQIRACCPHPEAA